ncbi:hypothetical protein WR25_06722 [Diploscapter pachys]|uniref:Uncharacterized protein n=1 Tax=Diploscapter pachys TaxID=2018661 RepID=A0A2A2M3G4_9BILA|nr:hypothetical protein WR25_06722 [Diploscapter pachys]
MRVPSEYVLVRSAVAVAIGHLGSGCGEIDHLGDVGGVIADALQVLGDEQQMGDLADRARVLDHVGDERAEDAVVEIVERGVAFDDADRGFRITRRESVERGADHRRHHLAQIDRHRRTQRDDADREPLHLRLDRIDRLVVGAHARGEFGIGAGERLHGECDGILGKPAHLRDHAAQLADIGVECLDLAGPFLPRVGEDVAGRAAFDQLAEVEEGGALGDARGLLHVVRDDDDGVATAQFVDQLLDARGGDGIERAARFVHQDDFGFHRDGAGDAQPLLLAPR